MGINRGKIVIIGASNVGSATLSKIVDFQLASEIALIDINEDKARGEALDASHSTSCIYSININVHAGTYADCKDAYMIIVTAGPSIRPNETPDRLVLAKTNTKIMQSVMENIMRYTKDAIILMITNPLDVATWYVSARFDYPREKIFGTGTLLETFRFRRALADRYKVDTKNIHGYVLGEHGNSAVPIWSTVNIAGLCADDLDDFFPEIAPLDRAAVEKQIVQTAYDVINWKGYTNLGIAMVACRLIKAVAFDEHTILPVSAILNGEYGIDGVALSVPHLLNARGIGRSFEVRLNETERGRLNESAARIAAVIKSIA